MANERNVFERLDNIEAIGKANNQMLNELLGIINQEEDVTLDNREQQPSDQELFFKFLKQSKKSWRWFGTKAKFERRRRTAIISLVLLICLGLISTALSTICFKIYSTFTLFENIWVIFEIVTLAYVIHAKYINEVNDFARYSTQKFFKNDAGMLFPRKTKAAFRVFKWLAIISVICNIVCVFSIGKSIKPLAAIFEGLFLLVMLFSLYFVYSFYDNYAIAWVEGNNLSTGERATVVLMPGTKQFISSEEFETKYPQLRQE